MVRKRQTFRVTSSRFLKGFLQENLNGCKQFVMPPIHENVVERLRETAQVLKKRVDSLRECRRR